MCFLLVFFNDKTKHEESTITIEPEFAFLYLPTS